MKRIFYSLALIAFSALAITSCGFAESDYDKQVKIDNEILADFLKVNDITANQHADGFYWQVIDEGDTEQELKKGDVVSFYYTISTLAGVEIEKEWGEDGGEPLMMRLKNRTTIPQALDVGVSLMNPGATFRFYIPSYLAYGSYAISDFGAYTNFIVDIEVLDIVDEEALELAQKAEIADYVAANYSEYEIHESPTGLIFIDSIAGTGTRPQNQVTVEVDLKRSYLDGTVTMKAVSEFINVGTHGSTAGLDEGLRLMKEGGSAILLLPHTIGFDQGITILPQKARGKLYEDRAITHNVKPFSILKYNVTLNRVVYH